MPCMILNMIQSLIREYGWDNVQEYMSPTVRNLEKVEPMVKYSANYKPFTKNVAPVVKHAQSYSIKVHKSVTSTYSPSVFWLMDRDRVKSLQSESVVVTDEYGFETIAWADFWKEMNLYDNYKLVNDNQSFEKFDVNDGIQNEKLDVDSNIPPFEEGYKEGYIGF